MRIGLKYPQYPGFPWLWLLAALIAHSLLYIGFYCWNAVYANMRIGGDFLAFWTAAKLLVEGGGTQAVYDTSTLELLLNDYVEKPLPALPYPPPLLGLLSPLGNFPFVGALLIWIAVTGFLYACSVFKSVEWKQQTFARSIIGAFVLLSPFALYTAIAGQSSLLMSALLIFGLSLFARSPWLAGACFAALTLKPQLALMIPIMLIAGKHWRTLIAMTVSVVVMYGGATLALGAESWLHYLNYLKVYTAALAHMPGPMMSLNASFYWTLIYAGVGSAVAIAVQFVCFVYAGWSVWKATKQGDVLLRNAVIITATFIAAPYIMIYDTAMCILLVLFWLPYALRGEMQSLERIALMTLLLAPTVALALPGVPVIFAVMVLNHVALMRRITRRPF